MRPSKILVKRLCDLYWPVELPADQGLSIWRKTSVEELLRHKPHKEFIGEESRYWAKLVGGTRVKHTALTDDWDLRRTRFFFDEIRAGRKLDPISIDNMCRGRHIYPQPIVIDGHHRLGASLIAGARTILAHYGGLVSLREYLTGRRRDYPD
jgi:hypothetical protein